MSVPASEYRPPASDVPPMTTARIASSSMNRPVLFASAAVVLAVRMSPAIAGAERRERVHGEEQAAGAHAGLPAGLGVDADRLDQHPERRAPGEHRRDGEDDRRDDHGDRDPAPEAGAERLERRAVDREDLPLGDEHRDAAAGGHQDERRDDGLDADHGDQQAVPHAEHERDDERDRDRDGDGGGLPGRASRAGCCRRPRPRSRTPRRPTGRCRGWRSRGSCRRRR